MKKTYTVTDLGPGDGGKGQILSALCHLRKPHTVIKVGGAQGSHGVRRSDGACFAFSQFGCGTFDGARTHLSTRFVCIPAAILPEAHELRYRWGVHDALDMLTIEEGVLCATPFHRIASQLRELARADHPRGTVGTGVGEAYHDAQLHPECVITARDLQRTPDDLRDLLESARLQKIADLDAAGLLHGDFPPADCETARGLIALLRSQDYVTHIVKEYMELAAFVQIVGEGFLADILSKDGVTVFESSHGVLTDYRHGFYPHVSHLRTLPQYLAWALLNECGYDGDVVRLAVSRAYQIRHGAGPTPTDDVVFRDRILGGAVSEEDDRYRGKVRVGPLDFVAMRYAHALCGGPGTFDALAITCMDQVACDGAWRVCDRYDGTENRKFFLPDGNTCVVDGSDEELIRHHTALTGALMGCRPDITTYPIVRRTSRDGLVRLCKDVLLERMGIPVRLVSFGPTEKDVVLF